MKVRERGEANWKFEFFEKSLKILKLIKYMSIIDIIE